MMIFILLWYIFIGLLLLQAYYAFFVFWPLQRERRKPQRNPVPVSVIICSKNDEEKLRQNLVSILEQKFAVFEVIVMDDHSEDGTAAYLKSLQKKYPNLTYLRASDEVREAEGKKHCLAEAIEKASNEYLLLTDADCRPGSLQWIRTMTSYFTGKTSIVLGIGQYRSNAKWFNGLIQYETFFTALSYLGFAMHGKPYMGVGRNLAYRKSLFMREEMLKYDLASGDDDLFVQQVATNENTDVCLDTGAQTWSEPPETYAEWYRQKLRHYSTAALYKRNIVWRLALLKATVYLPNFIAILLLLKDFHIPLVLALYFLRYVIYLSVLDRIRAKLGFTHPLILVPFYELYFAFFDLWLLISNKIRRRNRWK